MNQYDAISFAMDAVRDKVEAGANDDYCAEANAALYTLYKLQESIIKRNARSRNRKVVKRALARAEKLINTRELEIP